MKKIIILTLVFALMTSAWADKVRVSIVYVHQSVGAQMVNGYCGAGDWNTDLRAALDTMVVVVGTDTARIVYRDYFKNAEISNNPLSDTLVDPGNACGQRVFQNFEYDIGEKGEIWNSNCCAGMLRSLFNASGRADLPAWKMLTEIHDVPGTSGDWVSTRYDLAIFKNPYVCWFTMNQDQADSIKKFYEAVRDSIINHPEMNVALAFGTPLRINHECSDSSVAKITHDLATWFAGDNFFTHTNTGPYKNLWKWDSFRYLCETSPDSANRYCLKNSYHADGDLGSHLSYEGADISQDSLQAFIKRAVQDILIIKSGTVTREDIDRKIREFQEGSATEEDVRQLIEAYNNAGGK